MQQPPPEIPGDVFDRQRCLRDWNQSLIENQVAFVLGVGAMGCGVAIALARLVVDASNLNRQILFNKNDVGRKKVEAAAESLKAHIVGNTEVVTMHCNVLKEWAKVVEVARECTVLFNNIDIGGYFDYACLALAKVLHIPCAAGSSYGRTWIVEYFNGKVGCSSFSYLNKDGKREIFDKLHPSLICTHANLEFVPRDPNPPTRSIGSSILVAGQAALNTVSAWVHGLFGVEMPNYAKVDITQYWIPDNVIAWPPPPDEEEIAKQGKP